MGRTLLRRNRSIELVACAGAILSLSACGGKGAGGNVRADTNTPVNTGLANLDRAPGLALPSEEELMALSEDEASIQEQIAASARELEFYFTNVEIDGPSELPDDLEIPERKRTEPVVAQSTPTTNITPTQQPVTRIEQPTQPNPDVGQKKDDDDGVRFSLSELAGGSASDPVEETPKQVDEPAVEQVEVSPRARVDESMSPSDRRDALASELASILSEMVTLGENPGASALALASLETLLPEDEMTLVDSGVLSEPELATLNAVRDLLSSMVDEGNIIGPHTLADQLESIRIQLAEWSGIVITKAALCTRVDGFGRYETFPSYRFVAGRDHEMIVYTEVDNFVQEQTQGPDQNARYKIEMSQRLELYHVADDLNTWNRSSETVQDESRNRLRDYYLTNWVRLPSTLSVGRYHLKIVMRDLLGDRVTETIIPIEIVSN